MPENILRQPLFEFFIRFLEAKLTDKEKYRNQTFKFC